MVHNISLFTVGLKGRDDLVLAHDDLTDKRVQVCFYQREEAEEAVSKLDPTGNKNYEVKELHCHPAEMCQVHPVIDVKTAEEYFQVSN